MEEKTIKEFQFYTDGAYSTKSEMGGWATALLENNEDHLLETRSGFEAHTTGNRMELKAFLTALEMTEQLFAAQGKSVTVSIFTDSAYIANALNQKWYSNWLTNGWRTSDKQPVKNQDLWAPIISLYIKLSNILNLLSIVKVKGHQDNRWNKYVDACAVAARKRLERAQENGGDDL